jgi:ectoine hydroxylase
MLSEKQIEEYKEKGYLYLGQLFSKEEIDATQAAFNKIHAGRAVKIIYEEDGETIRSIMGWHHNQDLAEFAKDEQVLQKVRDVLGGEVEFHQSKMNPKAPDENGEKWDPHRGDVFWCLKDGVPNPEGILTVFIALTEQTKENGAVIAWEGSHNISLSEMKEHITGIESNNAVADTASYLSVQINNKFLQHIDEKYERVSFEGDIGSVWLIHSGLLHESGSNQTTQTRKLIANVFRSKDNRPKHPRPQSYLCESGAN